MALKKIIFFVCTILLLTACQNKLLYNQSESNIADVKLQAEQARHQSDAAAKIPPSMLVNSGLYVNKTQINLARDPRWLRNHIVVRGDKLPFSYYSRTIVAGGGNNILTQYQVGLDSSEMVTINYSGPIKGALDLLAAKTGYVYTVDNKEVYWQAFITRTFDIAFMPGSSDYLMGKASGGGGSSSPTVAGGSGGSGSSNTVVTGVTDDSSAAQYSNLKGTLSVWKDLRETIGQLLSRDGKVIVSEATTSVTVRDRPTNVELVSRFIANFNNNLSRQVLVKVQVLEVKLSSSYSYGINWNVVGQIFRKGHFSLIGNNSDPIGITTLGNTSVNTLSGLIDTGGGNQVQALINALSQQGRVSIVTEPRAVALNNQVSVVRIVNQEGYLASIQNTTMSGTGGSTTLGSITSQVTPGSLVTGLTLYILPKILDNKVYLQVNADLSTNQGFTTASTGDVKTNPNAVQIQIPNVSQKQFNQRSVISSGDTLILSGFRKIENQTGAAQLFDSQALGGQSAKQGNSETIVLITPIILRSGLS